MFLIKTFSLKIFDIDVSGIAQKYGLKTEFDFETSHTHMYLNQPGLYKIAAKYGVNAFFENQDLGINVIGCFDLLTEKQVQHLIQDLRVYIATALWEDSK